MGLWWTFNIQTIAENKCLKPLVFGWRCNSAIVHLPSMQKSLHSISSTKNKNATWYFIRSLGKLCRLRKRRHLVPWELQEKVIRGNNQGGIATEVGGSCWFVLSEINI
jgi:hypothetical protein